MDTSDYQLGAEIIQNKRPIAYWSRLLQPTQQKYTRTEKELLAIILCLKEYEKILYGAREIKVFTDHKNLTFNTLSVKRVLRWRTYIDQFRVDLSYIEGKRNVLADCFSRLLWMEPSFTEGGISSSLQTVMGFNQVFVDDNDGKQNQNWKRKQEETFINLKKLETPPDNDFEIDGECFFQIADDNKLINCLFPYLIDDGSGTPIEPLEIYLNVPDKMENPLSMQNVKYHQYQCQ